MGAHHQTLPQDQKDYYQRVREYYDPKSEGINLKYAEAGAMQTIERCPAERAVDDVGVLRSHSFEEKL